MAKCVSFNMHGINQVGSLVEHWCNEKSFDVVLLQELWLSPASLSELNKIAGSFSCFSVSSMEDVCNSGLLKGRPFGGLAVLVKQELSKKCKLVYQSERALAVKCADTIIVNVYFPCLSTKDSRDIVVELLGNLEDICFQSDYTKMLIGGDFNCDLDVTSWLSTAIHEFVSNNNLRICSCSFEKSTMDYTYCNEVLGQYSHIDYFFN